MIRVEKDTNNDQTIDSRDYFKQGKRIRNERSLNNPDRMDRIIFFDEQERPLKIKKDTVNDGLFDTLYHFKEGELYLSTQDTSGDGKPNVRQTYKNGKPFKRQVDD
ncbi:MAG: hypothetical protein JRI32_04365, partial [Deltaproteobacteria bacterium]|nr:hypothetical protein [Deltaproteobacteria bacterium]